MSRELDALVAEKVMGWTLTHRGRRVMDPDGRECGGFSGKTHARRWISSVCPPYTTDPAADYLVLEHVREEWNHGRFDGSPWQRFVQGSPFNIPHEYRPGDYSRAALAALGVEVE